MTTPSELTASLPLELRERCRLVGTAAARPEGEFVVYWMRTAVRAHENPALDVALLLGQRLEVPVFVYHAVDERYPYAADRHHVFILQGARDVARELAARQVGYALHVARPGHRGPHLRTLANRAAAVVTEEMPVAPLDRWTEDLAAGDTAVWSVDTACVVPMMASDAAPTRAFEFRRQTSALRRARVDRPWPAVASATPAFVPELPFEAVDAETANPYELAGECEIDHGVSPVPGTTGGSQAGYARFEAFVESGLSRYARDRNDPTRDGVSRLSPYLHYGMVSPFRIARRAAAAGGKGAEKFLDELLVWRELAYHFCFHRRGHATAAALPDWAREGLARHEADPRPATPSWESLARGRTGDDLWNAAQTSLLRHGELHNNVRMTWGKALLSWTPTAERALELLEDLNHRYALDGRDPSSYGGILWCLGQFDRPFKPERPVLGPVRGRSTRRHLARLDFAAYRRRVTSPAVPEPPRVLVVGGGISGLACARTLADAGFPVEVVDKGRRPGGRASTRRGEGTSFDHGAQYFTARDRRFTPFVKAWRQEGLVERWRGRIATLENGQVGEPRGSAERWVGVPGMSALAGHLAADLDVTAGVRVESIERVDGRWRVLGDGGIERRADRLVLALPAPQALDLLGDDDPLAERLSGVVMAPTLAAMVRLGEPWGVPFDGAFVADSPLSWIARDSSKPGRPAGERWVLHAGAEFSRRWLESSADGFVRPMIEALEAASGRPLPKPVDVTGHRWRYALAETPLDEECLFDAGRSLGICGDWCPGARIEGAFLSGVAVAGSILREAAATAAGELESARESGTDRPGGRAAQLPLDLARPAGAPRGGSAP